MKLIQSGVSSENFVRIAAIVFAISGAAVLIFTIFTTAIYIGQPADGSAGENDLWSFRGTVGDFVGGIVGSLFSLSSFFLIYLTFLNQKKSFEKERFESKFFDLLKLHRENVLELNISGRIRGRDCFPQMINEFTFIYKHSLAVSKVYNLDNDSPFKDDESLVDFSFKVFFFGVGYHAEQQLFHFLNQPQREFYLVIETVFKEIQENYRQFILVNSNDSTAYSYGAPLDGEEDNLTLSLNYLPFAGHSTRLGHYFRHLYQCVKFVDKQKSLLNFKERYFYLKTLRAQLSNHEQLLLYYDSLSEFGEAWHRSRFFTTYSLLKNLPLALVEVNADPRIKIGKYNDQGKLIFEWDRPDGEIINKH